MWEAGIYSNLDKIEHENDLRVEYSIKNASINNFQSEVNNNFKRLSAKTAYF